MADTKISAFPLVTILSSSDYSPIISGGINVVATLDTQAIAMGLGTYRAISASYLASSASFATVSSSFSSVSSSLASQIAAAITGGVATQVPLVLSGTGGALSVGSGSGFVGLFGNNLTSRLIFSGSSEFVGATAFSGTVKFFNTGTFSMSVEFAHSATFRKGLYAADQQISGVGAPSTSDAATNRLYVDFPATRLVSTNTFTVTSTDLGKTIYCSLTGAVTGSLADLSSGFPSSKSGIIMIVLESTSSSLQLNPSGTGVFLNGTGSGYNTGIGAGTTTVNTRDGLNWYR